MMFCWVHFDIYHSFFWVEVLQFWIISFFAICSGYFYLYFKYSVPFQFHPIKSLFSPQNAYLYVGATPHACCLPPTSPYSFSCNSASGQQRAVDFTRTGCDREVLIAPLGPLGFKFSNRWAMSPVPVLDFCNEFYYLQLVCQFCEFIERALSNLSLMSF